MLKTIDKYINDHRRMSVLGRVARGMTSPPSGGLYLCSFGECTMC